MAWHTLPDELLQYWDAYWLYEYVYLLFRDLPGVIFWLDWALEWLVWSNQRKSGEWYKALVGVKGLSPLDMRASVQTVGMTYALLEKYGIKTPNN
jgi:hypothetical protein